MKPAFQVAPWASFGTEPETTETKVSEIVVDKNEALKASIRDSIKMVETQYESFKASGYDELLESTMETIQALKAQLKDLEA